MSTRSLTIVKDDTMNDIMVMYRQSDGYPSGHGQDLADYLRDHKITNGIGAGATWANSFNGIPCMAASIVAAFKDTIGGIYLYAPQPEGDYHHGQEYIYYVSARDNRPYITMTDGEHDIGCFADDFNGKRMEENA
mgnify:CR=1 FL=1